MESCWVLEVVVSASGFTRASPRTTRHLCAYVLQLDPRTNTTCHDSNKHTKSNAEDKGICRSIIGPVCFSQTPEIGTCMDTSNKAKWMKSQWVWNRAGITSSLLLVSELWWDDLEKIFLSTTHSSFLFRSHQMHFFFFFFFFFESFFFFFFVINF